MSLVAGNKLGAYEILAAIGSGGMGDVYRAHDPRLGREVAIKVLPAAWSADPDRLARFEQEARAAAALNHPNILAVHDFGRDGSTTYLVTELLEGETLREAIGGPLPVRKAIDYAIQIASGLAAAHEKGIVHRDLKPENLFVTHEGRLKILDFGLAKLLHPESAAAGASMLATMHAATQPGVVLGTAGYMSPEQVRGLPADHRSDLFALGAVLYEMLSGRGAFRRETSAESMTAILKEDVVELVSSDGRIAPALERVVTRCLDKNPSARFQSAADLAFALEGVTSSRSGAASAIALGRPVASSARVAWAVAAVSLAVAFGTIVVSVARNRGGAGVEAPEMRLQIVAPATDDPNSFALSPDGRRLVYAANFEAKTQLWLRSMDNVVAQPLTGTDGAVSPFWSPDGQSIGFVAAGRLKRLDLSGGLVRTLPVPGTGLGGAWAPDGTILWANGSSAPLQRVSVEGGEAVPLTRLDPPRQLSHRFPQFLPDGRHFIYFASGTPDGRGVYVASLDEPQGRRLFASEGAATYLTRGFLLFERQGTLVAQRFDAATLTLSGAEIPVAEQVAFDPFIYKAGVSTSNVGTFVYRAGAGAGLRQLTWIDRTGRSLAAVGGPDAASPSDVELSPDGTRIAIDRTVGGNTDIWVIDAARNVQTRFTFDPAMDRNPVWSADGRTLAFLSTRRGPLDLYQKPSSGAGAEQPLVSSPLAKLPEDFSSDGRFLSYRVTDPQTGRDLWALPLTGKREPFVVRRTEFEERESQFSPDVRWVAYVSNQSGPFDVFVQPFPGPGGTWQISTSGGVQPRWRRDGKELFYIAPDGRLMAVPIATSADGQALQPGTAVPLFQTRIAGGTTPGNVKHQYAVSADGQRFLVNQTTEQASAVPITLVLNWSGARTGKQAR